MPLYLTKFELDARDVGSARSGTPRTGERPAQEYIESVGGTLHGFWYAFGEHDRLQPVGGFGQRVHGGGRSGDRRSAAR